MAHCPQNRLSPNYYINTTTITCNNQGLKPKENAKAIVKNIHKRRNKMEAKAD
jgi:hypothetical protein